MESFGELLYRIRRARGVRVLAVSPGETRKNNVYIATAFISMYCWYIACFRRLGVSPMTQLVRKNGAPPAVWESVFLLSLLGSFVFFLFFVKNQDMPRMRPVWTVLHIGAFVFVQAMVWMPTAALMYVVTCLGGICLGAVVNRVCFSLFLCLAGANLAKSVAVAYVFIQVYVHVYTILPVERYPAVYFGVEAATMAVALVCSRLFRGNELEMRRMLPENPIWTGDIAPTFAVVVLAQLCYVLYDSLMVPQMARGAVYDTLQIVPNVVTLAALYVFSSFFTAQRSLKLFLILFACGVLSFLLAARPGVQRVVVDLFIQPAYLFFDVFIVSMLAAVFYIYGNRSLRLRLIACAVIPANALAHVLVQNVFRLLPSNFRNAVVILSFVLLMLLLSPMVERFIYAAQEQRLYADSQGDGQPVLPPDNPATISVRGRILARMPQDVAFTHMETKALAYLIDNYDTDVMAYFMGVPLPLTRACVRRILDKCGVPSRRELGIYFRDLLAGDNSFENLDKAAARCKLTPREKQVARLLLDGLTLRQIGPEMGISFHTVNAYSTSIYRKFGINSRIELFLRFGRQAPESQTG